MTYPICAYYVNWLKEINKSFSAHWMPVGLLVLIGSLFSCQLQKAGNPFEVCFVKNLQQVSNSL